MKASKAIIAKNPKVNGVLLEESLKVSRKLAKSGVIIRRQYDLPSPFEKRLVKTSASELLSIQEQEE